MNQYNVLDYGAVGDGKTNDSPAYQAAVDAAAAGMTKTPATSEDVTGDRPLR